ncbi:O-antigen ligase family protein [Synergistaceae bacterium OttesenSCG-928-I11]|nr:O-antigen ligase family protein [Synergistaceae bacterium OttesenSCG-928-I11]
MAQTKENKFKNAEKFKGARSAIAEKQPLVPMWLLSIAFFISFALPNLVFSGRHFFDTLHIMKWTVTMAPIGVMTLIAGVQLIRFGAKRTDFTLDPFAFAWLILLLIISLQPLYIKLSSASTFAKEWFYFASLFAVYFLAYNVFKSKRLHKIILWGGNVNAAINVIFAELLIRGLNSGFPFILDVPGNYIGNTAQQEMFGLWTAMTVLNGLFLHLNYIDETEEGQNAMKKPIIWANLVVLAVNAWGLWSSTARGGILSLIVAFVVLVLSLWRTGQHKALRRSFKLFGVIVFFVVIVLAASSVLGTDRGGSLVWKMLDMFKNPASIAGRASIWKTSWEVYLKQPITGVGLGQYKWHFLDAQRIMYQKYPELYDKPGYNWQFTYWAHSEYIQWLAETGVAGAGILLLLGIWWLYAFIKALVQRKQLPPEAIWGIAMTFLLWFDALFSRPFHRIENSVWMALAFALANRSILPRSIKLTATVSDFIYKCFGGLIAGIAVYGFVFLAGGIEGDQLIYNAVAKQSSVLEKQELLKKAETRLMSRDDAKEQLAQLFINVGKLQKNDEIVTQGINNLYQAFKKRPTSKLLFELLNHAQEFRSQELLRELTQYLSPSMYRIQPASEAQSQ